MPSTTLGNIIFQLEGGAAGAPQGPGVTYPGGVAETFANEAFGQHPGFANQYGSGEAGVLNYANQILASNPNATVGEFYSSYNQATGNPANLTSLATLQARNPGAYSNFARNAGSYANTPLSSVLGAGGNGTVTYNPSGADTATWLSAANQGVGQDAPTLTDDDFSGLQDSDVWDGSSPAIANTPGSLGTGGANQPGYVGGGTNGLGGTIGGTGGAPINITDLPGLDTAVTSGAGTVGTDVQQSAGGIAGTAASIFNSFQSYASGALVVTALICLGLIFVAFGLGMFKSASLIPKFS